MPSAIVPTDAPRRAAIVGANRIPFARSNGAYARASNQDMLTSALDGLVARFGLAGERLGEVVSGAVLKHSRDFNLTRESVLGSRLSAATPTYDVQQACGTEPADRRCSSPTRSPSGRSRAASPRASTPPATRPIEVNDDLRRVLLAANRAKSTAGVLKALAGLRPGQIVPEIPANREPRTGMAMGEHAAQTAAAWGISRTAQDEITVASHQNLAAAYDRGFFDDLMTPYLGLTRDNNLRADSTLEGLAKLKPVFKPAGYPDTEATMTAANSTPLTDGAATVLLASDEWAAERNLPVLAHVVDAETAAVDYVHGDEGLLMAPAYAVPRMLERNGLTLQDFDFYEFHEAFASTMLATFAAWEDPIFCKERLGLDAPLGSFDRAKLNVDGLVAGHRPPLRGDRRPHRPDPGQAAAREAAPGARPDLDLRRRWPGRRRHPGGLSSVQRLVLRLRQLRLRQVDRRLRRAPAGAAAAALRARPAAAVGPGAARHRDGRRPRRQGRALAADRPGHRGPRRPERRRRRRLVVARRSRPASSTRPACPGPPTSPRSRPSSPRSCAGSVPRAASS